MIGNDRENPPIKVFVIISLIIVFIQIGIGLVIYFSLDSWSNRGSFGDMFGAIGAFFSGLALAGVIYTILLQREELKSTAKSQVELAQSLTEQANALKETAKLNALRLFPAITINVQVEESKVFFVIKNPSDFSAFDVDILIIGNYHEDDLDVPTFLVQYVPQKERRDLSQFASTIEGFYGVQERLVFAMFPQGKQNTTELYYPIPPLMFYCLLQFRDLREPNYQQVYWFFEEGGVYRLGSINPEIPTESTKIDFVSNLEFDETDSLPDYINEFAEFWNSSIPSGYLQPGTYPGVEDRGIWSSI